MDSRGAVLSYILTLVYFLPPFLMTVLQVSSENTADECTVRWPQNLLESSTQKPVTKSSLSKCKDTPAGVLQGSARSLVIFNIFINDQDKARLLNLQMTAS